MTFSASFRVDDVQEDRSLHGRVRVTGSVVEGTATGSIVSGEVSLVMAAGAPVAVDNILQISGWVRTVVPASPPSSIIEQHLAAGGELPTP